MNVATIRVYETPSCRPCGLPKEKRIWDNRTRVIAPRGELRGWCVRERKMAKFSKGAGDGLPLRLTV